LKTACKHGAKEDTKTKAIQDKLDAHQEKTETGLKPRETESKTDLEETEANPEKMEPNPEMMQSEAEHQEVPVDKAAMKPSGTMKKRQRPATSCKAVESAKGIDPKRLWFLKEVGCRLQKGVLLCSSGMAQEKHLQGNHGPRKE
jgi:hypothetical protein